MTQLESAPTPTPSTAVPSRPEASGAPLDESKLIVAVLGGGPAGSTLAALLADQGMNVILFDDGKRPDLIVGESLIPALVPIFRRLGIEERVAEIGLVKPGVSFLMKGSEPLHLSFKPVGNRLPQYSYNVPRPAFDDLLRERAREGGVHVFPFHAQLERDPKHNDAIRLTAETLAQVPILGGRQPDLIADCTGRKRTIARLLDLPSRDGDRRDIAHFAHFKGIDRSGLIDGQVVTGLMKNGWSWIIPLRGRESVGVVLPAAEMKKFGSTPEEQLLGVMNADEHLGPRSANAERLTDVLTYTNYQKITERGHGPNWVLMGDAFGFVDPMFSPGMFLAMHCGELLTDALGRLSKRGVKRNGTLPSPIAATAYQKALSKYDRHMDEWFAAWMELIDLIYEGKILSLREAGLEWCEKYPSAFSRFISNHMEKHMACMAAGGSTRSPYAWGLLRNAIKYGMRGKSPEKYRIN